MPDRATELRLVQAAKEHFDNIPAPEIDDPEDRDALMYQYSIARDAVSFFTKQRDKLLKQLLSDDDVADEVDHLIEIAYEQDEGLERLIEPGDWYNLHLKLTAPPRSFNKAKVPAALSEIFDASPADIREFMQQCTEKSAPRKTFTVAQKEHIG